MELTESIESINQALEREFGIDTSTGRVMYRVVFSDDQTEKRRTEYDDKGNPLLFPEVRELPKYRQWIKGKYILENLMYIDNPESIKELAGLRQSYEVIFVFDDKNGNPLPPQFEICKLVITTMKAAMAAAKGGGGGYVKYKEDLSPELREKEIANLQEELFGNEDDTTDALALGEGVAGFHSKIDEVKH